VVLGHPACSYAWTFVPNSEGPQNSDKHEGSSYWTDSTPTKKYRLERHNRERTCIDLQWLEEERCTIHMYLYTRMTGFGLDQSWNTHFMRINVPRYLRSPRSTLIIAVVRYAVTGYDRALRPQ
jgi:hypothetical protein